MTLSGRGGKREGSGRKKKPDDQKAKTKSFVVYDWEVEPIKQFIKELRQKKEGN